MSRWFGFIDDPTAGGSTFDVLSGGLAIPVPTTFAPVSAAQADPGLNELDRKNEVRGRRADTAPISFASAPKMTFEARGYPKLVRPMLRKALGGSISSTGTAPAAISSTVGTLQSGNLPAFIGWLLREGQLDRMTGCVISEIAFDFPVDGESTVQVTADGLFHDTDDSGAAEDPNGEPALALPTASYTGYTDTFMLRDATAFRGAGAGVEIPNLAGFGLTFNNGLIEDFRSRFRPNHNIESAVIDTVTHKLWYPERHKLGAQQVTGKIDLSDVDPDAELKHLLTHAEKLVFEVAAGPLGTTPAADEMMRLTLYKHATTGGGAEPLVREGDQVSSFEFSGYLDEGVNKDVEATFVGTAALT